MSRHAASRKTWGLRCWTPEASGISQSRGGYDQDKSTTLNPCPSSGAPSPETRLFADILCFLAIANAAIFRLLHLKAQSPTKPLTLEAFLAFRILPVSPWLDFSNASVDAELGTMSNRLSGRHAPELFMGPTGAG
jgi:hypothetical protein